MEILQEFFHFLKPRFRVGPLSVPPLDRKLLIVPSKARVAKEELHSVGFQIDNLENGLVIAWVLSLTTLSRPSLYKIFFMAIYFPAMHSRRKLNSPLKKRWFNARETEHHERSKALDSFDNLIRFFLQILQALRQLMEVAMSTIQSRRGLLP